MESASVIRATWVKVVTVSAMTMAPALLAMSACVMRHGEGQSVKSEAALEKHETAAAMGSATVLFKPAVVTQVCYTFDFNFLSLVTSGFSHPQLKLFLSILHNSF